LTDLDDFGISYNGYRRVADSPARLLQIVRPVIRAVDDRKPIPPWAGLDLLRAALFYVHRRGHFDEPSPELERQFRLLIARIREMVGDRELPRDEFN
jgi:hypothetical protein